MKDFDIKDYEVQLAQLCDSCKHSKKCKDKKRICALKKLAFSMAKVKYSRDKKRGLLNGSI